MQTEERALQGKALRGAQGREQEYREAAKGSEGKELAASDERGEDWW